MTPIDDTSYKLFTFVQVTRVPYISFKTTNFTKGCGGLNEDQYVKKTASGDVCPGLEEIT